MKIRNALIILSIAIIIGVGIRRYPTEVKKYVTNILEITRLKNLFKASTISYDYDLIVVGSGLAGLTATFESNKLFNGKKRMIVIIYSIFSLKKSARIFPSWAYLGDIALHVLIDQRKKPSDII